MSELHEIINELNDNKNTDIINVKISDSHLTTNNENFIKFTQMLPAILNNAKQVLNENPDTTDEQTIKQVNSDLHDLKKALPIIKKGRRAIKQAVKTCEQQLLDYYDGKVKQDEIEAITTAMHERQLAIESRRKAERWITLAPAYQAQIEETYPQLQEYGDTFNYQNFKNHNGDLISGAATKKVTTKTYEELNKRMYHYFEQWQILQKFKGTPQYDDALAQFTNYQDITVTLPTKPVKTKPAAPFTIGGLELPATLDLHTTDGKLNALYYIMHHLQKINLNHDELLAAIKVMLNEY